MYFVIFNDERKTEIKRRDDLMRENCANDERGCEIVTDLVDEEGANE